MQKSAHTLMSISGLKHLFWRIHTDMQQQPVQYVAAPRQQVQYQPAPYQQQQARRPVLFSTILEALGCN